MNYFYEKLVYLESAIAAEDHPFDLFALFSTDDQLYDKWDLVVSASWIDENNRKALDYLSSKLKVVLNPQEFLSISKIAPLGTYDPRVKEFHKNHNIEHRLIKFTEYRFLNTRVDIVYLITSKIQVNVESLRRMWPITVRLWRSGNNTIDSKEILKKLEEEDFSVPDYGLDRILEYLRNTNCIRGAQYMGSEAIKRHGGMVITFVDQECQVPELLGEENMSMTGVIFETARIDTIETKITWHTSYRERPLSGPPNDPAITTDKITFQVDERTNAEFVKRVRNDFNAPLVLVSSKNGELPATIQEVNIIGNPVTITVYPNELLKRQTT